MSQTNVNKWFHLLHTVLNNALAAHGALPQRDMITEASDGTSIPSHNDERVVDAIGDMPELDAMRTGTTPFFSMMEQNDR